MSVEGKVSEPLLYFDCSETFIDRPWDLDLQAATWSDYKHHNTLKYLVAIAPDGLISFISVSWGGRTTDRYIVQQSGFLDRLDPGDLVLADRGFTIQEDLLFRNAKLVIPPGFISGQIKQLERWLTTAMCEQAIVSNTRLLFPTLKPVVPITTSINSTMP